MFVALILGGFVLAVEAAAHGEAAWLIIVFAAISFCAVPAFIHRERRAFRPILNLALFAKPKLPLTVLTSVCSFTGQGLGIVSLPYFFQAVMGRTPFEAGLMLTPWPISVAICAPIAGRLADKYPVWILATCGLTTMATGAALLASLPHQPAIADILWREVIFGVGFGFFQAPNNRELLSSIPRERKRRRGRIAVDGAPVRSIAGRRGRRRYFRRGRCTRDRRREHRCDRASDARSNVDGVRGCFGRRHNRRGARETRDQSIAGVWRTSQRRFLQRAGASHALHAQGACPASQEMRCGERRLSWSTCFRYALRGNAGAWGLRGRRQRTLRTASDGDTTATATAPPATGGITIAITVPTAAPVIANPSSLTFAHAGSSQTSALSEDGYGSGFTATTSNPAVATSTVARTASGNYVLTVLATGQGTATISLLSNNGGKGSLSATVLAP